MDATPVLFWFDLSDVRKGLLHVDDAFVHSQEVRGDDAITFRSLEEPAKYDRILWQDRQDERWREHVVSEYRAVGNGTYEVRAESALTETRLDFMEAFRLENASYTKLLQRVLPYTRFAEGSAGMGAKASATAWITRKSVYDALRKIESIYGIEFDLAIEVDEDAQKVTVRKLGFSAEQGAWRGVRLTKGKNLHAGEVRVKADEVVTALYGFGASFGAYDEDGNPTGGFTRRLTFGSVNGGKNYVEDARAKERWGRVGADGERLNNFGYVVFEDVEKPLALYNATHAELQKRTNPAVAYVVAEEIDCTGLDVRLGDVIVVSDEAAGKPCHCGMRVVRRTRTFDEALVAAGIKEPDAPVATTELSLSLALRDAECVNGDDIDLRYTFGLAATDVYRYDLAVRNNLKHPVYSVRVQFPVAELDETVSYLAAGEERLFTFAVSPTDSQVAAGAFSCTASASCPAGNVGLASEYAACSLIKSHALPLTTAEKPVDTIPVDLAGDGTFANPYTVADMRRCVCVSSDESALEDVWLCGYIVGWAAMDQANGLSASTLHLSAAGAVASNIVLADAANETSAAAMCAVNLSTATKNRKAVRTALNLKEKPRMLGVKVYVFGDVLRYGRETGMKRTDRYRYEVGGYWYGYATNDGALLDI